MAEARAKLEQEGFSEREVRRILDRATRLQQRREQDTRPEILRESAATVGIPAEVIDRAIAEEREAQQRRIRTRGIAAAVIVMLAVFLAIFFMGANNNLNGRLVAVQQARAQLENVLQRRYDLIPNLVAVTRQYAAQERAVYTALAQARQQYAAADTLPEKAAANRNLDASLSRFYAVVENYPELRSSEVYTRLQDELAGTENRISVERMRYNQSVAEYNRAAHSFPLSVFRALLGYPAAQPFFEAAPGAQKAPRIE